MVAEQENHFSADSPGHTTLNSYSHKKLPSQETHSQVREHGAWLQRPAAQCPECRRVQGYLGAAFGQSARLLHLAILLPRSPCASSKATPLHDLSKQLPESLALLAEWPSPEMPGRCWKVFTVGLQIMTTRVPMGFKLDYSVCIIPCCVS